MYKRKSVLDQKLIRENPRFVEENLSLRGKVFNISHIHALTVKKKELDIEISCLQTESKKLSKLIGQEISKSQNNNSQDNNTDNSSDNTNNTIDPIDDNNQTNLEIDVDNDGVLDTSDNCLDTKPGEAVDEFGCTILEQDANDELQDNGNDQQEAEATSSKSDENNILLYVVLGLVIAAIVGGVLVIRSRKSSPQNNVMQSTSNDPIMPLPAIPMPTLEPVVLQQWTDGNGYSWRQMSDQSIMWWNGSEWIPYGKN